MLNILLKWKIINENKILIGCLMLILRFTFIYAIWYYIWLAVKKLLPLCLGVVDLVNFGNAKVATTGILWEVFADERGFIREESADWRGWTRRKIEGFYHERHEPEIIDRSSGTWKGMSKKNKNHKGTCSEASSTRRNTEVLVLEASLQRRKSSFLRETHLIFNFIYTFKNPQKMI